MNGRRRIRLGVGVALCVIGFALAKTGTFRETTIAVDAGGCHLVTDVMDKGEDEAQASVVLLHGLSANKKIMEHLARGFAEENLRVFVPDLPGHGRTPGPFSFARAESCSESFLRELIAQRVIDPRRTILAGHSMGGAIAIRVAARVGVAGVIAISPAPMRVAHGVPADMLPYTNPPPLPPHTLAMSAAFEPLGIRESTRELVTTDAAATSQYLFVPRATHVSVLFDRRVVRASQEWAAKTLGLNAGASVPSSAPLVGSLLGLSGILLLAGPFLRETLNLRHRQNTEPENEATSASDARKTQFVARSFIEVGFASLFAVIALRLWNPLSFLGLYSGGYFASFMLIAGLVLLVSRRKALQTLAPIRRTTLFWAAFAAVVLHLLVTAWFDATLTESWVSAARWGRFPVLFVAALAYLLAEELLLDPMSKRRAWMRLVVALALRLTAFIVLVFGIFVLHSGAILLILLAIFLALFFVFQRLGMDVVRRESGSALAAAVFGAILLAAFCLVIFPVT